MVWRNNHKPCSAVSQTMFSYCLKTLIGRIIPHVRSDKPYVITRTDAQHCTTCSEVFWPRSKEPMQSLPAAGQGFSRLTSQPEQSKARSIPCSGQQQGKGREVFPLKMQKNHFYIVFSSQYPYKFIAGGENALHRQYRNTANRWGTGPGSAVPLLFCCLIFSKSLLIFIIYSPLPGLILVSSGRYKHSG